jgi:hypothetical protein
VVIDECIIFEAIGYGTTPDGLVISWANDPDEYDSVEVCPASTIVSIDASAYEVPAGGTVNLTVCETNDGDVDLILVMVDVYANGVYIATVGLPDLAPGQTECGVISDVVIEDGCVTFEAYGYGEAPDGLVVTYPDDPEELDDVEVCTTGEQGCTPGFWKVQPNFEPTHCWCDTYDPTDLVSEVFATIPAGLGSDLQKKADGVPDTLDEALAYQGGGGVEGAARNLLRSAVAAVLNACNDNVAYPMGEQAVIDAVDAALASLDRDTILALHTELDGYNNLGCSIDNHCLPIPTPTPTPAPV